MAERPAVVATEESASAELVASDKKQRLPQRLAVCLDGSWNKRGSGTNIYHISNLIQEGEVTGDDGKTRWLQRVYYDEGVGTGLLDGITGGAFGVGVSENVRQAYDWLVENYWNGDEVYIFGFSRGAFTARSLVGLIAKCGLVYRGAPIPQEQLWEGYQKLGSKPEWRNDQDPAAWAKRVEHGEIPFRPLKFFKKEPWDTSAIESPAKTHTEKLLYDWSRRIPITCLAVFDSVGTFGIEAVAIPWLQERRAQFHDTGLSSCVVNGLHAIAIDEYRANFSHLPWRRPVNEGDDERIKQCWFIGAHSNIGGGYSDNTLSQFPLHWMIKGCKSLGLRFAEFEVEILPAISKCLPLQPGPKATKGKTEAGNVGDSFSAFLGGIWRYGLRNKRNYRWIAPPEEYQNGRLVKSHEVLHLSVEPLVLADKAAKKGIAYNPPNLWSFWQRHPDPRKKEILGEEPDYEYFENQKVWIWTTIAWLVGISAAGYLVARISGGGWWFLLILAAPLLAFFTDRAEGRANYRLALDPGGDLAERRRSLSLDKLLNIRFFFLGASLVGLIFLIITLAKWLTFPVPAWEVLWLFGLALIAVRLKASWDWTALPMAEMGTRSGGWLSYPGYPARFPLGPADEKTKEGPEVRRLWIKRALFRDLAGFIPASFLAIGFGWWITFSLIGWAPFSGNEKVIWGGLNRNFMWHAVAIAALCALCAVIENRRLASAVKAGASKFSSSSPTKVIFWLGIAGFLGAILGLAGLHAWRLCRMAFMGGAYCLARLGWVSGTDQWEFTDLRIIHTDKLLPIWLAVIASFLALSCLRSALKQKPAPPSADRA